MSVISHSSAMRPSSQRLIVMPVNATSFPLGGVPISSPSWVPVIVKRVAT